MKTWKMCLKELKLNLKHFDILIVIFRVVENSYSGVLSGEEKVLFFSPEKETGAESLKAPESVSGVLRVF